MPREIVHDNTPVGPGNPFGVNPDNSTPMAVEVSWGKEGGYVSIGSVNLQNSDGDKRYTSEYGWFANFENRSYINQLIRVLRRARDQAWGADE